MAKDLTKSLLEQTCTAILLVTTDYGSENSWSLGSCHSNQIYGSDQSYSITCCQPPGNYRLYCYDSFGDGWHGGYIEIEGNKYCDSFSNDYDYDSYDYDSSLYSVDYHVTIIAGNFSY